MEIYAAIRGLASLPYGSVVSIYSDSAYLVNTMRNEWWRDWKAADWIKKDGTETPNKAFWVQLIDLCEKHDVTFVKVQGHSGDWINERCDYLAKHARKAVEKGIS